MCTRPEDDIFTEFMELLKKVNTQGFQLDLLILDNKVSPKML